MDRLVITTPRGSVVTHAAKNGAITARLEWNPNFGAERTQDFSRAQKFIDSEVLRLCDPYVPFRTGVLCASGILGTVIGSGKVRYIAPYAARLYYNPGYNFQGAPMRGAYWFERMKVNHKIELLSKIQKMTMRE